MGEEGGFRHGLRAKTDVATLLDPTSDRILPKYVSGTTIDPHDYDKEEQNFIAYYRNLRC